MADTKTFCLGGRRAGGHACGVVETGSIGRDTGAPYKGARRGIQGRSYLAEFQERPGVEFTRRKRKPDAIADMDPKLIWQEGQSLVAYNLKL
jgi:hypothetical protein